MSESCLKCGGTDDLHLHKISPILPGWPKEWGEREPSRRLFHKECYKQWYKETYHGLAELDRSVNESASFRRTDPPYGGLIEFEGKQYPAKSWWRGEEVECYIPELRGKEWWQPRPRS